MRRLLGMTLLAWVMVAGCGPRAENAFEGGMVGLELVECDAERCGGVCCDGRCVPEEVCESEDLSCGANGFLFEGVCACRAGFSNCDADLSNGCETDGVCACELGEQQTCFDGPSGRSLLGICSPGVRTCLGGTWSECE